MYVTLKIVHRVSVIDPETQAQVFSGSASTQLSNTPNITNVSIDGNVGKLHNWTYNNPTLSVYVFFDYAGTTNVTINYDVVTTTPGYRINNRFLTDLFVTENQLKGYSEYVAGVASDYKYNIGDYGFQYNGGVKSDYTFVQPDTSSAWGYDATDMTGYVAGEYSGKLYYFKAIPKSSKSIPVPKSTEFTRTHLLNIDYVDKEVVAASTQKYYLKYTNNKIYVGNAENYSSVNNWSELTSSDSIYLGIQAGGGGGGSHWSGAYMYNHGGSGGGGAFALLLINFKKLSSNYPEAFCEISHDTNNGYPGVNSGDDGQNGTAVVLQLKTSESSSSFLYYIGIGGGGGGKHGTVSDPGTQGYGGTVTVGKPSEYVTELSLYNGKEGDVADGSDSKYASSDTLNFNVFTFKNYTSESETYNRAGIVRSYVLNKTSGSGLDKYIMGSCPAMPRDIGAKYIGGGASVLSGTTFSKDTSTSEWRKETVNFGYGYGGYGSFSVSTTHMQGAAYGGEGRILIFKDQNSN